MDMSESYDSDFGEDDGNFLEPQVILGDPEDDLQNMSDDDDGSDTSALEVYIDESFAADNSDNGSNSFFSESMDSTTFDIANDRKCFLCHESLSLHVGGQPCGEEDESSLLLDESSTSSLTGITQLRHCPICRGRNPSREHLANHFMEELSEVLDGETSCSKCDFQVANSSKSSPKSSSRILALHHVTDHGGVELDELLNDSPLVQSKKEEFESKRPSQVGVTQRTSMPPNCPICDQPLHKQHSRDHVSWHFMEELRQMVSDPTSCPECTYTHDKQEAVCRHLALFHCKLDEFLKDSELVALKRAKVLAKPKKVSIGLNCIICGMKEPSREHVTRHFSKELLEIVSAFENQTKCPECSYRGEKPQNLARHIALVHSKLDELLADKELVESRKQEHLSKLNKVSVGDICPVCNAKLTKNNSRVHLIWHFIEELRAIVNSFADSNSCEYCDYKNTNSDKVVKHIALGHSKLDEMLSNEELIQKKRALALSKPKKFSIGPNCPICDIRDPPREHVARHFSEELLELVAKLPDQQQCGKCPYKGERPKNLGLHIALVHGQLDAYLKDKSLVDDKRSKFMSRPKKQAIGPMCPICDLVFAKSQNRDHVAWHFIEELREFVQSFDNPNACWQCEYTTEKLDNLVKHIALGHSKLDELLADKELVAAKRAKALAKPKKVSISSCPICDVKDPAREHVARHFSDELIGIVSEYPDPTSCVECEYKADRPKTLSIHVALVHGRLDLFLMNNELVNSKRENFLSKPKKVSIGPSCPVCGIQFTKTQNRDHVAWHYMDELRSIVQEFDEPSQCPQCPYKSDTTEKMVKHVALGHSMLDALLQDEKLLEQKRAKAMMKPKKVSLGNSCPICDTKEPTREHVSRHFSDELLNIVMDFEDPHKCSECSYKSEKPKNVAIHIALVHAILDHFLSNEEIVKDKREAFLNKPQRVNVGSQCPICDITFAKGTNRDHICWHFIEELRDYVLGLPDTTACNECPYTSEKLDNLAKHVALGHARLDLLLQDENLVAQKREIAMNKPKKINIGPQCPVCDLKFTKNQNRDHVSWHFMDEFREFVQTTGNDKACQFCPYVTEKPENLLKHYALGHSKLDELLQDEELVARKREIHQQKPKRLSLGPDCVVCGVKGRDRDHMARHYMNELMELVNALPNKRACNMCEYKHQKAENMAKHLALFHCKLDELLMDEELLKEKRQSFANKPQRVSIGDCCVICSSRMVSREHVCRHFLPELLAIVNTYESNLSCGECEFTATKAEYVARHLGLVHLKLDEFLMNEELVEKKKKEFESSASVRVTPSTPTHSLRKSSRAKVAPTFFKDEVDDQVSAKRKLSSNESPYKASKFPKLEFANDDLQSSLTVSPGVKIKKEDSVTSSVVNEVKSLLKTSHDTSKQMSKTPQSLLRSNLLKQDNHTKISTNLSPSISLSPAGANIFSNSSKPDPRLIEEVNNSWAESLLSRSKRSRTSSSSTHEAVVTLPQSVTLQRITPTSTNGSRPLPPPPPLKLAPYLQASPSKSICHDDDEDISRFMLEPQVILDTSATDDQTPMEIDNVNEEVEFCDVCSMELVNHADEQPCEPNEDYVKMFKFCRVCDARLPTREHVSRHFLPELLEVVECFEEPLSCPQCDCQAETACTIALHIALVHQQVKEYIEDNDLVRTKRQKLAPKISKVELGDECPVCGNALNRQYKRDHVIWHFMDDLKQLAMSTVEYDGVSYKCMDCDYIVEKLESIARHLGLYHSRLDMLLRDGHLLDDKRAKISLSSRPSKREPINVCPICDFKEPSREHISRHFMAELLDHVATLENNLACSKCSYKGERPQNLAKHIALVHSKLDEFLKNPELVQKRRNEVMSKPKKISIGSVCPVCKQDITKRDSRVHVIWHFMDDLRSMVQALPDPRQCQLCPYSNPSIDKMAKHMALGHSKLDELLSDDDILKEKQEKAMAKPKKLSIGPSCPVCGILFGKSPNRDHVAWHFMDELREYVLTFDNPKACNQCPYTSEKLDNLVKHIALGHSKLDELLLNEELLDAKRAQVQAKPKKLIMGPTCPICDITFSKNQSREHVCWHFMEELREIVHALPDPNSCTMCEYVSDKVDNLVRHIALGHSKLDEFLLDADLVAKKRETAQAKVKRVRACQICFAQNPSRDHLLDHFADDLVKIVDQEVYDQLVCDKCAFRGENSEMLGRHLALNHGMLEEFLSDANLVARKRATFLAQKQNIVQSKVQCIVCDEMMLRQNLRKHCANHFCDEMKAFVRLFSSPTRCDFCADTGSDFQTANLSNMCLHVALAHSKVEEMLADEMIVRKKRLSIAKTKSQFRNGSVVIPSVTDSYDDIAEPDPSGGDEEDLESLVEDEDDQTIDDVMLDELPVTAELAEDEYEDIIYEEDSSEEKD